MKKPSITRRERTAEDFETLKLHTDRIKAEPKIILRDVAKENTIKATPAITRAPFVPPDRQQDRPVLKATLPEQPVAAIATSQPQRASAKLSARELKEQEIRKAVNVATRLPQTPKKNHRRSRMPKNFGVAKAVLTIACLSTAVFAVVYFINLNSSNVSLKVAAVQSGIEAVYPSYIPRGYALADVTSASGKITMKFKADAGAYTITEEQAEWNSAGVLANYVKPTYGDSYTVIEEQGLTLYTSDHWAAWVNGGMFYTLTVNSGSLTKKQIKTIATSL